MINFFILDENFEKIINTILNDETILKINSINTGWTNIVYKVETSNQNYYFRFPRDEFWERTIVKDFEFSRFISGKTSFKTVNLKLFYDKNRPFSVHKEIPGVPLADKMNSLKTDDIQKISFQISKFMYELHNIDYNENEIFDVNNIGLDLNSFIDELLDTHVNERDRMFWNNSNFKFDNQSKCLVHGDLNSSNVLLDDDNNVTAIIDFGFAGYGNKYFDLSRIIGRCPESFTKPIICEYEKMQKNKINNDKLMKNIETWKNIDLGYKNYMKEVGIC